MSRKIQIVRRLPALRRMIKDWRSQGRTIALLPTMGALHDGHLKLVRLASRRCERVVVSIFVNPGQFAPHEDMARYPRDEAGDVAMLEAEGADLVWAPTASTMYPFDFATQITPGGVALGLESDFRPHFFGGVATVCAKLFCQVLPDIAVFGEKDYQQLLVVKQLVRDLNLPLKIVGCPIVRERDGLALSSRNKYLAPEERQTANLLNRQIHAVADKVAAGGRIGSATKAAGKVLTAAGFLVDYVEVRDGETLAPVRGRPPRPLRVLGAAWLGNTRLIDNIRVR